MAKTTPKKSSKIYPQNIDTKVAVMNYLKIPYINIFF
jgi:hypothetical protein